ncbi:MAG: hypothetical protein QOD32_2255 [Pyrinomonadaceae bacterium]|jgi:hypothetical protein|nr:hypothetical protein [Pyrinomonadaceae bacterium]
MLASNFQVVGRIEHVEVIAVRHSIRVLDFLKQTYGRWRWRKLKGVAGVLLGDGTIRLAELHWYEAHGIGNAR